MKLDRRVRRPLSRLRRALGSQKPSAYHLELEEPILIRHGAADDRAALERLAAIDSRQLPEGPFLLAEIDGELVAAVSLDVDAEPISDPFQRTANVRELLELQAGHIRRHRAVPGIDARRRSLQERPMTANQGEAMSRTTIGASLAALVTLAAAVLVLVVPANAASSHVGVGFNAASISGFHPGGEVFLTGGGAYDPGTASNSNPEQAFVHSNGGFRCLNDVGQGPLQGCLEGQGIRWDTDGLLQSTGFKCTGSATEAKKTAVTDAHTEVLLSDFYRAGDGNDASFKNVQVIISDHDLAPDIDGVQNVWIEKVGCGSANVNFSS